jgi:RNA recognition motif-containing protein
VRQCRHGQGARPRRENRIALHSITRLYVQIDPKRAIPRDEQDKTSKIFVGGIGQDVVEEEFKDYFEQFGTVLDATLMMDKETGRPRGFGFVTFDDDSAVENCMAHSPLYLKQKMVIPLYVGMVNASD